MKTFTFTGPKGETTTVTAKDEAEARHKAMVKRWGPPSGIYPNPYQGRGLTLIHG